MTPQSFRCFPISNSTELDVWAYIARGGIEIAPLSFAASRPVIRRSGMFVYVRVRIKPRDGEAVEAARVRFRTLGCQICTGAVESAADTLDAVVAEAAAAARNGDRQNRAVDKDRDGGMEEKKREESFEPARRQIPRMVSNNPDTITLAVDDVAAEAGVTLFEGADEHT